MHIVGNLAVLFLAANSLAAVPQAERDGVVESNTGFALDLYGALAKKGGGNLLFSPYSISTALAMTWAGARGQTAEEMARVLHFASDREAVPKGFSVLQQELVADAKAPFELAMASRLFAQSGFKFLEPFLDLARDQ
jgi:serpin B